MNQAQPDAANPTVERPRMDVDVVCVGFGPAMAGFLTTLSKGITNADGSPITESAVSAGMPPQVICYERADDLSFGVSGVVTAARAIRESLPDLNPSDVPMAAAVGDEKVIYLLDPIGASRRSFALRAADQLLRWTRGLWRIDHDGLELPWTPAFLHKHGGLVLSLGQFMQWVGTQLMSAGTVQIWPSSPVVQPLWEGRRVVGVRLADQGTDRKGQPSDGYLPGMEVKAALTVVGDGPVGAIGRELDRRLGLPEGHHQRDWAVGMKMVVELPDHVQLAPGTVFHTFGFPEPEIFGFFYVHPDRVASLGIFVPSWFDSPVRTAYRYLQHWMMHPYLWRYLEGGRLRSWGAKTLQESGRTGEPHWVGDGFARIGEGSGSTNVLTGSGVDEAWATGVQLGESVLELWRARKPFTQDNLEQTYSRRRRESWVEREGRVAERARNGFHRGVVTGMLGMALSAFSGGRLAVPGRSLPTYDRIPSLDEFYRGRLTPQEVEAVRKDCQARGVAMHSALMERCGWPAIPYDGQLLVSHQDALLLGGKVQAPNGYADHVTFLYPNLCQTCGSKVCVEMCSGQAILPGADGVPHFEREKCVHCGACLWNCAKPTGDALERTNAMFRAGPGGLHSAEN